MQKRLRSPRERKMAISLSQPSNFRNPQKIPLILPVIKSKKQTLYQQLIISPEYVKIKTSQKTESSRPLITQTGKSSRMAYIMYNHPRKQFIQKLASEDRIVQKYEQEKQRYKEMLNNIHRKSMARSQKKQKGGLSLIYERLMGML